MASFQLAAGLVLGDTWQERIIPGIQVTVIGMAVVFTVLILLYGILVVVGRLLGGQGVKAATLAGATAVAPVEQIEQVSPGAFQDGDSLVAAPEGQDLSIPALLSPADSPAEAEGQLVAVIAAALAAGTEQVPATVSEHRGRSVAAPAKLGWALAGRTELLMARERLPRG